MTARTLPWLAAAALLAVGCGGVRGQLLAHDPRGGLERRQRAALLATVLDDPVAWAYGDPPAAAAALSTHYRSAAAIGSEVLPVERAPEPLRAALVAARAALGETGRVAPLGAADADLVLLLGVLTDERGRVARVTIHAGGPHEGRFERELTGLSAVVPEDEADDADAADLAARLVKGLPRFDPDAEPP